MYINRVACNCYYFPVLIISRVYCIQTPSEKYPEQLLWEPSSRRLDDGDCMHPQALLSAGGDMKKDT